MCRGRVLFGGFGAFLVSLRPPPVSLLIKVHRKIPAPKQGCSGVVHMCLQAHPLHALLVRGVCASSHAQVGVRAWGLWAQHLSGCSFSVVWAQAARCMCDLRVLVFVCLCGCMRVILSPGLREAGELQCQLLCIAQVFGELSRILGYLLLFALRASLATQKCCQRLAQHALPSVRAALSTCSNLSKVPSTLDRYLGPLGCTCCCIS